MKKEKDEPIKLRRFGGLLLFGKAACADKETANHQKRHLKAYLKGQKVFTHGRDNAGHPKQYYVNEKWISA